MADKPDTPSPPHKNSVITLREITEHNWRPVANLRPTPAQQNNLAPNPMSMVEAHYSEDAWMRAVYADETIVGFLMLALWPPTDGYYIWRFMIDQRYQGLGFGKQVVRMAIDHVRRTYPEAKRLGVMSTPREGKEGVKAQDSPWLFYERLGFRQTAGPEEDEDGDVMMMIDL